MANKKPLISAAALKEKDDNFFSMPKAFNTMNEMKWYTFDVRGLKPNTRYKVMLDNYPGKQFEDITDFSRPLNSSVINNTHRGSNNGRMLYLKSDANGRLEYKTRPYGTESVNYGGTLSDGTLNFSSLWDFFGNRSTSQDYNRERIFLIEYSQVIDPDSTDKVKTVKFEYGLDSKDDGTGSFNSPLDLPAGILADCSMPSPGKIFTKRLVQDRSNFYQTFYVDSKKVGGAQTIDLTDVVVYLRRVPRRTNNTSGVTAPGIRMVLLECTADGVPITNNPFVEGVAYAPWETCKASPLATSATTLQFESPVTVQTNKYYALGFVPEDEGFVFWYSTKGDLILNNGVKTEKRSVGASSEHRGALFNQKSFSSALVASGNSKETQWQPDEDSDLKFDVNIAEYQVTDVSINLVNDNYEFLQLANSSITWAPGEEVYKEVAARAGTISITAGASKFIGTGTDFSGLAQGQKIVVTDGTQSNQKQVFTVDRSLQRSPFSATILYVNEAAERSFAAATYKVTVVGEVDIYDSVFQYVRLRDSSVNPTEYTANNDLSFAVGDTISGIESQSTAQITELVDLPISAFRTNMNGVIPPEFNVSTSYNLSVDSGANTYVIASSDDMLYLNAPNHVNGYEGNIISRSKEVENAVNLYNGTTDCKSSVFNMAYTYKGANTKSFTCPNFDISDLQIITHRWNINNDSANEHTTQGNAITKHVSKLLEFDVDRQAEDIRVIVNAFRPRNTNVEVYAKIINSADSESFETKSWTKLDYISNENLFSDPTSLNDFKEYEFSFPYYPPTDTTLAGEFSTEISNNVITTATANVELISDNDIIKLYSPLFPENYGVFSVSSVNAAAQEITLNQPVANVNIAGDGFKIDTLSTPYTAFKNIENSEIVRYFGTSGESYDNYAAVAIKIILLAESRSLVPKVDDYRVIGVSA